MALPARQQLKYWGIAAAVFLFVLWWLGDVILPFILGGAIAYCLDPLADRLQRLGLSRVAATSVITVIAILLFVVLALLVIPTLINQAVGLVESAPKIATNLQTFLTERFPDLIDEGSVLRKSLVGIGETVRDRGGQLLNGLLASVGGIVNVLVLFVIVPVVAFYLLLDWDRMVAKVDAMVPREHVGTVRRIANDIDSTLAGFIRGQGTVCLILGIYYAGALALVGLNFGLVVGAIAGFLTFIPYVGALVGGALALGLALFQFWGDWLWIAVVAVIFFSGQFAEGNILTPKLVGQSVGLHPVWLIFALSAFGAVFGFVGLLVAVPVAASLGVVIRYGLSQYRQSLLYRGQDNSDEP
ncbi:AI-2E family transporter [Oceaniovalibus sp. ACAM 378]|uniref:AI-2E family transporter n=1 Tax=Oceaniovalibus sp. ACAM 378 TaxID=2599923 RepID=UPI0011D2EC04|nr:AI-2E family transporter [Oceaniovalibus sp. ACAM 378]TYB84536.1 AI-2E family transporter [Oceaniovalibus sp. ACAM 378]